MPNLKGFFEGQGSWIRKLEHLVLRVVSFVFSVGGAYAFGSFFAPLDAGDSIQGAITASLSLALGLASYFLSRGIADRLMAIFEKENHQAGSMWSIVVFVPLFLVCEFLEIFTNYAKAIPAVHRTEWLSISHADQLAFHVFCTYLVYCVVPLVSPCLAVIDMGLERKKSKQSGQVPIVQQRAQGRLQGQPVRPQQQPPPVRQQTQGQPVRPQQQPPPVRQQTQGQPVRPQQQPPPVRQQTQGQPVRPQQRQGQPTTGPLPGVRRQPQMERLTEVEPI